MFLLGRPINNIGLNGLEFVLDKEENPIEFNSKDGIKQFAYKNGATEEDFNDGCIVIAETKEDGSYEIL